MSAQTSSGSLIGFLKSLGPFAHLTPAGLAALLRVIEPREYPDGARIIARGEAGDAMYIVQTGEVRIPLRGADGREVTERLPPGSFFGEMALFAGEPRTADVFACGPTRVLLIKKNDFHEITQRIPSLSKFLTEIIAGRFEKADLSTRTVGRWKLVAPLGRGDRSIVYEGLDPATNRRVAVKMLSHRLGMDPQFCEAYQTDMRVLTELEHEGIVRILAVEQAYATLFVIMEFVDGALLSKRLERGRMRPAEVRDFLAQACRALEYVHERGIVHRALEPSNVFLTNDGRVKLADFGLVTTPKAGGAAHAHGADDVGRPEYMSPEQLHGRAVDARSDIYALGALAYHMLAGEAPPRLHGGEAFPSLKAIRPGLPGDLLDFVERATRKEPEARFQTAEEAERALAPNEPDDAPAAAGGDGAAAIGSLEGRVVTIFFDPGDAARVEGAIAMLRQQLGGLPGIRIGSTPLRP